MVKSGLDDVFAALSDPTRRAMVDMLAETGPRTAGELAAPHPISLPAASKHLAVLTRAGLTSRERRGRHQIITLNANALRDATRWLERHQRFWTERIDALEDYLAEPAAPMRAMPRGAVSPPMRAVPRGAASPPLRAMPRGANSSEETR